MIITALRRARKPPRGLIRLIFRALGGEHTHEPPEQGRELVGHVRDAVGEPRRVLDGYEFHARELEAGRFREDGHGEARRYRRELRLYALAEDYVPGRMAL